MPEINFILPHWLYWGALLVVPLTLMALARRVPEARKTKTISLPLSYFLLLIAGFIGVHRLYLKSKWAFVFIAVFVSILYCNDQSRDARNEQSIARNEVANLEYDLKNAVEDEEAQSVIDDFNERLVAQQAIRQEKEQAMQRWFAAAEKLGLLALLLLLLDVFLLPKAVERRRAEVLQETEQQDVYLPDEQSGEVTIGSDGFSRAVSTLNKYAGEFVSYWAIIAVFAYFFEVIARYVFNSPSIWAHEGMYLMFGMQYLIAGGFCLRENAHVRVDVLYTRLSKKHRAIADIISSAFFFLFAIAVTVTGWIFFNDAFQIREVSFTEWAIAHYPVKFTIPLGGFLLSLQGLALLLHNIEVLRGVKK